MPEFFRYLPGCRKFFLNGYFIEKNGPDNARARVKTDLKAQTSYSTINAAIGR